MKFTTYSEAHLKGLKKDELIDLYKQLEDNLKSEIAENETTMNYIRAANIKISKKDLRLINDLLDYFKNYSAVLLTDITCGQAPWIDAHVYHQDNEVTCDSIRNYFLSDKDEKSKRKSLKNIHDIEEIKR